MPDPSRPPPNNPVPYRPRVILPHRVELDGELYEVHPHTPGQWKVYRVLRRRRGRELRNVDRKTKAAVLHELNARFRREHAEREQQARMLDAVSGAEKVASRIEAAARAVGVEPEDIDAVRAAMERGDG
jgi:hypothetical protein